MSSPDCTQPCNRGFAGARNTHRPTMTPVPVAWLEEPGLPSPHLAPTAETHWLPRESPSAAVGCFPRTAYWFGRGINGAGRGGEPPC